MHGHGSGLAARRPAQSSGPGHTSNGADVAVSALMPPSGCGPLKRTTCGQWTFSLTRPPTGRRLNLCNIIHEHTREALAMRVARTCTADGVVAVLDRLIAARELGRRRLQAGDLGSLRGPCLGPRSRHRA